MRSFKLDWKGWWLLRTPMSNAPELGVKSAVFAVIGARLKKIHNGVGCSAREIVLFAAHHGESTLREHLESIQRVSLGVFALNRCKEINKHAVIYSADVPGATPAELADIVALLYASVAFAPKHAAMPGPYTGEALHIINGGRHPGLAEEIFHGANAMHTRSSEATVNPDADSAMAAAMARELAATRRTTPEEVELGSMATERVAKPPVHATTELVDKPPRLVETVTYGVEGVPGSVATEKVEKPQQIDWDDKTEFVPRPAHMPRPPRRDEPKPEA